MDLLVEAATCSDDHRHGQRLAAPVLRQRTDPGDPPCRFRHPRLVLDRMPLEEGVLGFSNRWHASALRSPIRRRSPIGTEIARVHAPPFVASKAEAFRARGGGDYLTSSDPEDELANASRAPREFAGKRLGACLASRSSVEALSGYGAVHAVRTPSGPAPPRHPRR